MAERSSALKALLYVHIFVSGNHQMCSLLYSVCQLHHVCRVDAEEDVQDFRLLCPGLDPPQVVVLFLYAERASIALALTLASSCLTRSFPFFSSLNGRPLFTNDVCIPFSLQ